MEIVLPKEVKDGVAKIEIEMGKGKTGNVKEQKSALLKMLDGELKRPCALAPYRPSVYLSVSLSVYPVRSSLGSSLWLGSTLPVPLPELLAPSIYRYLSACVSLAGSQSTLTSTAASWWAVSWLDLRF